MTKSRIAKSVPTVSRVIDADSRARHRRERNREIIAPVVGAVVLLCAVSIFFVLTAQAGQVNVAANCLSVIVLTPLVLVCAVPYVLLLLTVFGVGTLYSRTSHILRSIRTVLFRLHNLVYRLSIWITKPVIAFNKAFTQLERLVTGLFDRKSAALPSSVELRDEP